MPVHLGKHLARAAPIAALTLLSGCAGYYGSSYYGPPAYYGAPAYAPGYAYAAPPVSVFGFGEAGPAYPLGHDEHHRDYAQDRRFQEDLEHHVALGGAAPWHAPAPPAHLPAASVHAAPPHPRAPVWHGVARPAMDAPGPRN